MFHITSVHFQHVHCIFVLMVSFVCLFVFEFYLIFRINFRVGGGGGSVGDGGFCCPLSNESGAYLVSRSPLT